MQAPTPHPVRRETIISRCLCNASVIRHPQYSSNHRIRFPSRKHDLRDHFTLKSSKKLLYYRVYCSERYLPGTEHEQCMLITPYHIYTRAATGKFLYSFAIDECVLHRSCTWPAWHIQATGDHHYWQKPVDLWAFFCDQSTSEAYLCCPLNNLSAAPAQPCNTTARTSLPRDFPTKSQTSKCQRLQS